MIGDHTSNISAKSAQSRYLESRVRQDRRCAFSMRNQLSSEPTHRMDGRNTYRRFNISCFTTHVIRSSFVIHESMLRGGCCRRPLSTSRTPTNKRFRCTNRTPPRLSHVSRGRNDSSRAGDCKPDWRRQGGTSCMKTGSMHLPAIDRFQVGQSNDIRYIYEVLSGHRNRKERGEGRWNGWQ